LKYFEARQLVLRYIASSGTARHPQAEALLQLTEEQLRRDGLLGIAIVGAAGVGVAAAVAVGALAAIKLLGR